MLAQWTGAIARAFLVVMMIVAPSLLLPASSSSDATQIVALVALLAGGLTLFEYSATYPGIVEFRDAPPFNRIRFGAMFITVCLVSVVCQGPGHAGTFGNGVRILASIMGDLLDFPYSPVRLMILLLPSDASALQVANVRMSAGLAYFTSLMSLVALAAVIRVNRWPLHGGSFNVWVNLPTFDPTGGGDVVARLMRDSHFNIALGFVLPFLLPAVLKVFALFFDPVALQNPQTLTWTVTAWALLPSSLFMRGLALHRIAQLLADQRRRAVPGEDGDKEDEDSEYQAV